jgi:hypothetical protein
MQSFRLLARMQGRNLFRYLHRIIRKTLYLMILSTYSLLQVCFLLPFLVTCHPLLKIIAVHI